MAPLLLVLLLLVRAVAGDPTPWWAGVAPRPLGPPGVADVVDVAADGSRVALVTGAGEVWVSDDGGAGWSRVRAGRGVEGGGFTEAALLDVEARAQELLDEVDPELLDEAELAERLRTEALQGGFAPASEAEAGVGWRVEVRDGRVEVGGPYGLVSLEGGRWTGVADGPVTAWTVADGRWIVGGPDGVRVGGVLTPLPPVRDLVVADGRLVAATVEGLWTDDEGWRPVPDAGGAWRRLVSSGDAVVAVGPAGVLRLRGDTIVREPGADDARDVTVGPGGLVLVTRHGLRVGVEGGAPASLDLGLSELRAAAWVGGALVVGGARGLHVLGPATAPSDVALDLPPLAALHAAATRPLPAPRAVPRAAGWLAPAITLELRAGGARTQTGLVPARGLDGDVQGLLRLTWRPPAPVGDAGGLVARVDDEGRVQVYGGAFDAAVLLAGATRRLQEARARRLAQVSELVARRATLPAPGHTLREQVAAVLGAAEIDARLDALTDGAVARWRGGVR